MKFDLLGFLLGLLLQAVILAGTVAIAIYKFGRRLERRIEEVYGGLNTRLSLIEQRVGDVWAWFRTTFGPDRPDDKQ